MEKRNLVEEPINGPVSAFAARGATRVYESGPHEESNPPKKRRTRSTINPSTSRSPANRRPSGYYAAQAARFFSGTCLVNDDERDDDFNDNRTLFGSSGPEISLPMEPTVRELSTFTPTKDNVIGESDDEWTIRLNFNDTVTLVGQYDIWVREGAVSILGAILHSSSSINRVYAPSTHALPTIRPVRNPYGSENQSVIITISAYATRIRMLKELSPKFGRIWNHKHVPSETPQPGIDFSLRPFVFLKSSTDDRLRRPLNLLDISSDWWTLIHQLTWSKLEKPMAVMICGPKRSGKSTFCRILANSILTQTAVQSQSSSSTAKDGIAFLDLDPGQPEYSPSGEISLIHLRSRNLGVPYTHPIIVSSEGDNLIRAHHVGGVTFKDDPAHYLRCALNLLYHHKHMLSRYPSCPLIVNCSGWVHGGGLEILTELIRQWNFTNIVHISKLEIAGKLELTEVVETLADSAKKAGVPLHTLTVQPSELTTRTAADLRLMQTMSYFHLDEPEGSYIRWNPIIINEMPPLTARYAGARQDIFAIIILGDEQDPEFLASILNGSVVGLVAVEDDTAFTDENYSQNRQVSTEPELDKEKEHEEGAEITKQAQWMSPQTHQNKLSSDSESDQASNSSRSNSFWPYASRREGITQGLKNSKESWKNQDTESRKNSDMSHPLVLRTPEGLPYLSSGNGTNTALDPFKSHSIGQALVRGIDTATQTLHLLTPIAPSIFQSLQRRNTKIVLVRGKLDMPTWAYQEEYFAVMAHRRRARRKNGDSGRFSADEMRSWAEGTPWAQFADGKQPMGPGAKVWRIRRNLNPRD